MLITFNCSKSNLASNVCTFNMPQDLLVSEIKLVSTTLNLKLEGDLGYKPSIFCVPSFPCQTFAISEGAINLKKAFNVGIASNLGDNHYIYNHQLLHEPTQLGSVITFSFVELLGASSGPPIPSFSSSFTGDNINDWFGDFGAEQGRIIITLELKLVDRATIADA